jgi:hypothetical protein
MQQKHGHLSGASLKQVDEPQESRVYAAGPNLVSGNSPERHVPVACLTFAGT